MLYPSPTQPPPAPTHIRRFPAVELPAHGDGAPPSMRAKGAEALTPEDRLYLQHLSERRRMPGKTAMPALLTGWVRQSGNYTIACVGWNTRSFGGIGIAKRNPAADAPDAVRGRQIALARALFDLLGSESRMPEPENRNGALIHAGNTEE